MSQTPAQIAACLHRVPQVPFSAYALATALAGDLRLAVPLPLPQGKIWPKHL